MRRATPPKGGCPQIEAIAVFDADDFDIEVHASDTPANVLGLDGGLLVVRRRSSQHERFYATGSGSAWSGAIFMDLVHGRFGVPAAHNHPRNAFV